MFSCFTNRNSQIENEISYRPQMEHNFFRTSLIPSSPVRGDYLERHLDIASKIIILRSLFLAILSALVIGFICAIFWMGSMRDSMCLKDPPEMKFGAFRRSWIGSHKLASLVDYHCINNSISPVVVTLRCTYKRNWEIKQLYNESCKCEYMPPSLPGAFIKFSSIRIGALVSYYCDAQFLTTPVQIVECSVVKKWVVLNTSLSHSCISLVGDDLVKSNNLSFVVPSIE